MELYTLGTFVSRINQSIRDALGLPVEENKATWIVAAHSRTSAVNALKKRGFPDMAPAHGGLAKHSGRDVDALRAAGLFEREIVLVTGFDARTGTRPVAVVDDQAEARRIGILHYNPNVCLYVADDQANNLTPAEQVAMDVWLRGSADTGTMLRAVRAAFGTCTGKDI
ncbi:hypothetical protein [Micromonospora peucetia]|uniref:Uncharacterized protein n=1 Tax=Micromonospora peucetia TaxID=47871 RepID=A0ABZ1EGL2_9ACTN|nr:hypothetical protein [Micromonospora peucetia]WSA33121.1 hypothetical protein OIE14_03320 [Micromonospora peucetia]